MLYEAVVELIGEVPVGYEPLVYVMACLFLMWLLWQAFSILWTIIRWLGVK